MEFNLLRNTTCIILHSIEKLSHFLSVYLNISMYTRGWRKPCNRMLVEEWPRRYNDKEDQCCPAQTDPKCICDVASCEANDESNSLGKVSPPIRDIAMLFDLHQPH
jgi:hypothetical protein